MSTRTDYAAIIAKTNYTELSKKLDELTKQEPPSQRKSAADAIAPVADKLRELHAKGWSFEKLAESMKAMGCPVKASALREQLGKEGAEFSGAVVHAEGGHGGLGRGENGRRARREEAGLTQHRSPRL